MNALRKILMPLLLIPLGMFIFVFSHSDGQWENSGLEFLFMVIGIPILMINFIAWFYPEIITAYFPVREDWGQKEGSAVTFAIVVSAFIAFVCVCVGTVFAVAAINAGPGLKPAAVQPITATAFARSIQILSSATASGENEIVSTPRPSQEANLTSDQIPTQTLETPETPETPQIPISGGTSTDLSTVPATRKASPAVTPTNFSGSKNSAAQTNTPQVAGACTPASTEYLNAVSQEVQDGDPNNKVQTAWVVQSNAAAKLWFIAAKIHKPGNEVSSPGVWALFDHSGGSFDMYAINDVAKDLSYTAWGEDSDPVLTMQSNGAQVVYDCAAQAQ